MKEKLRAAKKDRNKRTEEIEQELWLIHGTAKKEPTPWI